jgi:hypothetical protein
MMRKQRQIKGIDINPLMVPEKGAVAVDARITLRSIPTDSISQARPI